LAAISLLVVLLWGCFLQEQLTVRHARRQNARVFSELRALRQRQRLQPVSFPVPHPRRAPLSISAS
jgi:hypothetical protein